MVLHVDIAKHQAEAALAHLEFKEGLDEFTRAIESYKKDYLEWPVFQGPVDWIYHNIVLSAGESSRPGNMKLSVYQREIASQIIDPSVRQITCLKGVQIGYSKVLKAVFAYVVAYLGKRVAVAFPTTRDVKRFYKDEISDMYRSVEALARIVRDLEKGVAADTWYEQRFINGAIAYFRAAFNEDDLQSFTSWLMEADEVDRSGWQPKKDSAGNKLQQFKNRGVDFTDSKLIVGSTPGLRHISVIWPEWLTSDQRKLRVKCPNCGAEQSLVWGGGDPDKPGFAWHLDADGRVSSAYYRCEADPVNCHIQEIDKEEMFENGRYVPTKVATVPGNVGLHIPSWISMSPGASWKVLAQKWLNAQDDIEKLKEFVMFNMAEPWDEFDSRSFHEERLSDTVRPYAAEVPDDVVVLTAGGDDQTNKEGNELEKLASRELSIYGWNRSRQPRLIGHWVIPGEVGDPHADAEYQALLDRAYSKADGTKMYVQAACMDMGGHHGDETRIFANKFKRNRNIWAVRGASQTEGKRLPTMWPKAVGKSAKGLHFYTIDSHAARDKVAERLLMTGKDAPMFPSSIPDGFLERLTCEHQVLQKNGGYHWEPKKGRRAEEEWMCLAYAFAALEGLKVKYVRWRDLNLAAKRLGMSELPPHDPETGELLEDVYGGEDRSVMASLIVEQNVNLNEVQRPQAVQKTLEQIHRNAEAEVPKVAPHPSVRKRQGGRVVRSTSRW